MGTSTEERIAALRAKYGSGTDADTEISETSAQRISNLRGKYGSGTDAEKDGIAPTPYLPTTERNAITTRDSAGALTKPAGNTAARVGALQKDTGTVDLLDTGSLLKLAPGKILAGKTPVINPDSNYARRIRHAPAAQVKQGAAAVMDLYGIERKADTVPAVTPKDPSRIGGAQNTLYDPAGVSAAELEGRLRNVETLLLDVDAQRNPEQYAALTEEAKRLQRELKNTPQPREERIGLLRDDVETSQLQRMIIEELEAEAERLKQARKDALQVGYGSDSDAAYVELKAREDKVTAILQQKKDADYHEKRLKAAEQLQFDAINQPDFAAVVEEQRFLKPNNYLEEMWGEGRTSIQMDVILYYEGTGQYKKAKEYNDAISWEINARKMAELEKAIYELADTSKAGVAALNIVSSFGAPTAWIATLVNEAKNAVTGTYKPADTNSVWYRQANVAEITQKALSDASAIGVEIAGKDIGSFLAETGLSLGQFLSKVPLGPAALAYMGASSAGTKTTQLLEGGATADQALKLGAVSGIIEGLTEKIGLDSLMDIAMGVGAQGMKAVLKQMAAEGSEELLSELSNTIAELAVLGRNSDFWQYVDALQADGISKAEAQATAFKQFFVANSLWAAAGGALSGAATGAGGNVSGMDTATSGTQFDLSALGQTKPATTAPAAVAPTAPAADLSADVAPITPSSTAALDAALEAADKGYPVTNSMAEAILAEPESLAVLGIDTNGLTRSRQRGAVKAAVAALSTPESSAGEFTPVQETAQEAQEEAEFDPFLDPLDIRKPVTAASKFVAESDNSTFAPSGIKEYQRKEHHGRVLDALRTHLDDIAELPPVKHLAGTEFQKSSGDKRTLRTRVIEFFNSLGNKVTRPGFGDIYLNEAGARDSLGHGYGKLKAATFAALPEVLRDGKIIDQKGPYEGHEYDSFFIAAPVTIGGETCYVGTLVIKDEKTQRYKLHEVLLANKNGTPSFKTESPKTGRSIRDGVPFDHMVSQDAESVKAEDSFVELPQFKRVTPLPADDLTRPLMLDDAVEAAADADAALAEQEYAELEREAIQADRVENQAAPVLAESDGSERVSMDTKAVMQLWKDSKAANKNYQKVRERIDLSEEDSKLVSAMIRGDVKPEDIRPDKTNKPEVMEVYKAAAEYEQYARQLRQWNKQRKQRMRDRAAELLETSINWKDKLYGILYERETFFRNVRDIVPDANLAEEIIDEYYAPVQRHEADATREKEKLRNQVKDLNLSRTVASGNTVSEAYAAQLVGEAEFNVDYLRKKKSDKAKRDGKTAKEWEAELAKLWDENPNLDREKIHRAVTELRQIYDDLFDRINDARVRNGYEPMDYRQGYFPHFQGDEATSLLEAAAKELGISAEVTALPTTINGMTESFKPGIRWFGNALHREGFNTTYDAVEGFERYLSVAADIIYHTEDIQKLRAFTSEIRYRSSDEGTRKQLKAIEEKDGLSEEERQSLRDEVYKNGKFALGNFVVDVEEYTNLLAGKRSKADRRMEQKFNRQAYNVAKKMMGRVAANMVAVNPGSWVANLVPLFNGASVLGNIRVAKAMWDTIAAQVNDDGVIARSDFLVLRRGSDPLIQTWQEKMAGAMSTPMQAVDMFVAETLVRARYAENLRSGMSELAAMREADAWVPSLMAGRSKGSMPTLFHATNPIAKLATQFQLEVNNDFSVFFKDIPREAAKRGAGALALILLRLTLNVFFFNEAIEKLLGRRIAIDPLDILNNAVGDFTGYELPNVYDLAAGAFTGEMPSFEVPKEKPGAAAWNTAQALLSELPFTSVLGALGLDVDGGRFPVASAIPDAENILVNGEWKKELSKPLYYLATPFGGGQIKKAVEGISAVAKGGSYTTDGRLQYPVYTDTVGEKIFNTGKAVLFGKSSLGTAQDWVEGGFGAWDENYTAAYQNMREAGMGEREAYEMLAAMKDMDSKKSKLWHIAQQDVSEETAQMLAGLVMGTELETAEGTKTAYAKLLDAEAELGLTAQEYLEYYNRYGGAAVGGDGVREAYQLGVDPEDYLQYKYKQPQYNTDGKDGYSAAEKLAAIEASGLTGDARTALIMMEFPDWAKAADKYDLTVDDYAKFKQATNGRSGRDTIVGIISRMDVPSWTKDKYYLAAGFAESKLSDTPWH